jgi:hypothetical protein
MEEVKFTPEELSERVSSNYGGNSYTGEDDIYLDYLGIPGNLLTMSQSRKRTTFRVKNETTTQKMLAISPGSYRTVNAALVYNDTTLKYKHPNGGGVLAAPAGLAENDIIMMYNSITEMQAAGHSVDALIDDGIIYAEAADPTKKITVTAINKESSIRHFLKYIDSNPTTFLGLHISSDDASMYETELITRRCSVFGYDREIRIPFQDAFTSENKNEKKIIVTADFQFDSETVAFLSIPSGATVTITLVAGAVESSGVALTKKVVGIRTGTLTSPAVKPAVKNLSSKTLERK